MEKVCKVDGCITKALARELCRKHYQRWLHHGHTDLAVVSGPNHPNWTGNNVSKNGGRRRAIKMYRLGKCDLCDKPATDRHHKDDNTANNNPDNIQFLCRHHHMAIDGRLDKLAEYSRLNHRPLPPTPCIQCDRLYKPLRKGLCSRCYDKIRKKKK